MADSALRYIFILSLVLILVAYWLGTQNVTNAFGSNLTHVLYAATGRDSSGAFAGYPH